MVIPRSMYVHIYTYTPLGKTSITKKKPSYLQTCPQSSDPPQCTLNIACSSSDLTGSPCSDCLLLENVRIFWLGGGGEARPRSGAVYPGFGPVHPGSGAPSGVRAVHPEYGAVYPGFGAIAKFELAVGLFWIQKKNRKKGFHYVMLNWITFLCTYKKIYVIYLLK